MQATASTDSQAAIAAEINPDDLLSVLGTVTTLVDEAKLHISDQGLLTKAVDPASVAMVELFLDADGFERLDVDSDGSLLLGVDLDRLTSQISDIADEPVGDEEQTLHLELDEESRKLHVWADPGSLEFTTALIDPDSIRQEPDLPEMELPAQTRVTTEYMMHTVKTASNYSNHLTIEMSTDPDELTMKASGDTADLDVNLDEEHPAIQSLETTDVSSIFSLNYLDDMRKGIPKDAVLDIRVGDNFPMKMMVDTLNGNAEITYMVAPRIESDE
jgi:proliferating cell nuclear antigen